MKDQKIVTLKDVKPLPFIIFPQSLVSNVWNVTMMLLMLYTASYVPYKTALIDEQSSAVDKLEIVIDSLFIFDLFVNFISAFEDRDSNLEFRLKYIAI